MSKTFDPKQQKVLDCSSQNQLVSAGAGSGKTTVMIRKIADLLLSKEVKPSEIVVLTFTNLASLEMKQRLEKTLQQELENCEDLEKIDYITKILYEIETAYVDTIDGFCSKMCKKYFFKLNFTPDTSIATGLTLDYYVETALDLAIQLSLETNKEEVIELADCFEKNSRNLDALKENLLNTFHFIMAQKDYKEFLERSSKEYMCLNNCAYYLNHYLLTRIRGEIQNISYYLEDIADCNSIYTSIKAYIQVLNRLDSNASLLENVKHLNYLPAVRFTKTKDEYKDSINNIKAPFKKLKQLVEEFSFLAFFEDFDFKSNNHHFTSFISLLNRFITAYQDIKLKHKVVDFLDLERKFLELLNLEDVKNEMLSQFKYIFVDEYQDINPMQDEIINELKSETAKIFFVGDVKQSIYGFRQSTPELFLQKYNQYKKSNDSSAFDMNINFRSNPKILEFNNEVFSKLMTEADSDIDYKKDAQFDAKRTDFETQSSDVEIAIFNEENSADTTAKGVYSVKNDTLAPANSDSEANWVADKILGMVGKPFYDSATKTTRNLEYSDIAILSRSINDSQTAKLINVLKTNHIPINITNKTKLNECESVYLVYNILKVINNSFDDVALVSFMCTDLAKFNLEEIASIVAKYPTQDSLYDKFLQYSTENDDALASKIKYALYLMEEIRLNSLTANNLELIDIILNQYHLKHYILNSKNGENELNSLNSFLSTISNKENEASLTEFINFIKNNLDSKTEYNFADNVNSITLQTIHASKGLEYPVVILYNASKDFKPNNYRDDINFDSELGIGMQYFDLVNRTKIDSIPRFAIRVKNKVKCYKEELRLLYVATTRPKNKLIITGRAKFSKLEEKELSNNNFLELIYSVYSSQVSVDKESQELKNCVIYHYNDYFISKTDKTEENNVSISVNSKNIDFEYPNIELKNISLKNNVTSISKELNEDFNIMPKKLKLEENLQATLDTSAEIGTKYHKALSEIDFTNQNAIKEYKDLDNSLIQLAYDKIQPIAKGAKNIKQEAQFLMYVPYNEIYKDSDITNKVLVQGVVDLMIEFEEEIVLIDFKYSKLNIDTLKEKYSTQLELYKLAIEKAYNKRVAKSLIYKIDTGEMK